MAVQLNSLRPAAFHIVHPSSVASPEERTYDVIRLGTQHREAILEHLREFFFRDEPLNIASGVATEEDFTPVEEYTLGCLGEGLTLGAVAPDGTLVGVCLNAGISREEDEDGRREWEAHADDLPEDRAANLAGIDAKFKQIKRLLERTAAESRVFGLHPEERRLLDLCVLSVHPGWRGVGMAKRLVEATREMARSEGFRLLRVICTSHFSALAAARMGFECVLRLDYQEVRDRQGRPVFSPEPPHREAAVYVLRL